MLHVKQTNQDGFQEVETEEKITIDQVEEFFHKLPRPGQREFLRRFTWLWGGEIQENIYLAEFPGSSAGDEYACLIYSVLVSYIRKSSPINGPELSATVREKEITKALGIKADTLQAGLMGLQKMEIIEFGQVEGKRGTYIIKGGNKSWPMRGEAYKNPVENLGQFRAPEEMPAPESQLEGLYRILAENLVDPFTMFMGSSAYSRDQFPRGWGQTNEDYLQTRHKNPTAFQGLVMTAVEDCRFEEPRFQKLYILDAICILFREYLGLVSGNDSANFDVIDEAAGETPDLITETSQEIQRRLRSADSRYKAQLAGRDIKAELGALVDVWIKMAIWPTVDEGGEE